MGIGDWGLGIGGLGIGDWGFGVGAHAPSPIPQPPTPQSPRKIP